MALVSIPWQLRPLKAYFAKTKTKVLFCLPLFCFVLLRNNILDWHCVMKGDPLSWDHHQLCVKRRQNCQPHNIPYGQLMVASPKENQTKKYQFFLLVANWTITHLPNVHSDTIHTLEILQSQLLKSRYKRFLSTVCNLQKFALIMFTKRFRVEKHVRKFTLTKKIFRQITYLVI